MASGFVAWAGKLDKRAMALWREAVADVRQRRTDMWNGIRFFLAVNGILVAAIASLAPIASWDTARGVVVGFLALLGFGFTALAIRILKRERGYYLDVVLRRTFMEKEMGFYELDLTGEGLPLAWGTVKDKKHLDGENGPIKNPNCWKQEQINRKGTVARPIFVVYWVVMLLHCLILAAVILRFCLACC